VASDGFQGFSQRRYQVWLPRRPSPVTVLTQYYIQNGTFAFSDPVACSPIDPTPHSCARGTDNDVGFYECKQERYILTLCINLLDFVASSWEMSFFAPHSMADLVRLMGGPETFIQRV
jgi:hypothetical protein